jgi:predicted ATPase
VAGVLVGRSDELALVSAFVERARTGGEALLLFGEPGVGKTVLLDSAAEAAAVADTWVLRAAGVEFEADLTYSALHQVLLPLLGEFAQLSAAHRDALNVALGYGEGPPPARLLVSTATLTVLRQAAAARPVLMIVDDLPWLDRASAGVLASWHAAWPAAAPASWLRHGRDRRASSSVPGWRSMSWGHWMRRRRAAW